MWSLLRFFPGGEPLVVELERDRVWSGVEPDPDAPRIAEGLRELDATNQVSWRFSERSRALSITLGVLEREEMLRHESTLVVNFWELDGVDWPLAMLRELARVTGASIDQGCVGSSRRLAIEAALDLIAAAGLDVIILGAERLGAELTAFQHAASSSARMSRWVYVMVGDVAELNAPRVQYAPLELELDGTLATLIDEAHTQVRLSRYREALAALASIDRDRVDEMTATWLRALETYCWTRKGEKQPSRKAARIFLDELRDRLEPGLLTSYIAYLYASVFHHYEEYDDAAACLELVDVPGYRASWQLYHVDWLDLLWAENDLMRLQLEPARERLLALRDFGDRSLGLADRVELGLARCALESGQLEECLALVDALDESGSDRDARALAGIVRMRAVARRDGWGETETVDDSLWRGLVGTFERGFEVERVIRLGRPLRAWMPLTDYDRVLRALLEDRDVDLPLLHYGLQNYRQRGDWRRARARTISLAWVYCIQDQPTRAAELFKDAAALSERALDHGRAAEELGLMELARAASDPKAHADTLERVSGVRGPLLGRITRVIRGEVVLEDQLEHRAASALAARLKG